MGTKVKLNELPAGHSGKGYVEIDGRIIEAFIISKIEGKATATLENKQFLGTRVEQNAIRGMKIGGNLTYYHFTNAFIQAIREYKNGGDYPEIRLQYYSDSSNGREEISLSGVILNDTSFGVLDDSSSEAQKISTDFVADDFDVIGKFDE